MDRGIGTAPQSNGSQGEINSIQSIPIVTLPKEGPHYKAYYVTEHQLKLIEEGGSSHHLSFASIALGVFFTSIATFAESDLYAKHPKLFIFFVVLTIISGFATPAGGVGCFKKRKRLGSVFSELRSQYKTDE
jgi:hypothetical protein